MAERITIEKLHAGYKLTAYPQRSLVLSAEDLLDIYHYIVEQANTLVSEAISESDKDRQAIDNLLSLPPLE